MSPALFSQNVITVIWDFDRTLIPGYMQDPLFRRYGVSSEQFWNEVNALPSFYSSRGLELVSDSVYLNHVLTYVRHGQFAGLSNATLRELGADLSFYEGVPGVFDLMQARLAAHRGAIEHELKLEHYVVSTGLRQMILGSAIAPHLKDVWACEFVEAEAPPGFLTSGEEVTTGEICQVGYVLDNTTKTRAIFEVNKGCNVFPTIEVNSFIAPEHRRVPIQNMIYVADGPSDVPVFSVVRSNGGRTYAVWEPGNTRAFAQADDLLRDGRVEATGEARYTEGSPAAMWLGRAVDEIAERITTDRERALAAVVRQPPKHLV